MGKSREKKQFLFVCQGKDCKKNGSIEVCKLLKREIKSNGLNRSHRVIKSRCTDHCKSGPVIIHRNDVYLKMKPADVNRLVRKLEKAFQVK